MYKVEIDKREKMFAVYAKTSDKKIGLIDVDWRGTIFSFRILYPSWMDYYALLLLDVSVKPIELTLEMFFGIVSIKIQLWHLSKKYRR